MSHSNAPNLIWEHRALIDLSLIPVTKNSWSANTQTSTWAWSFWNTQTNDTRTLAITVSCTCSRYFSRNQTRPFSNLKRSARKRSESLLSLNSTPKWGLSFRLETGLTTLEEMPLSTQLSWTSIRNYLMSRIINLVKCYLQRIGYFGVDHSNGVN